MLLDCIIECLWNKGRCLNCIINLNGHIVYGWQHIEEISHGGVEGFISVVKIGGPFNS